jgi:hypothetical protein
MEIPVSGYLVHSDDSDSYHSHNLYMATWDGLSYCNLREVSDEIFN